MPTNSIRGIYLVILSAFIGTISSNCSNPDNPDVTPKEKPVKIYTTSGNGANKLYEKSIDFSSTQNDQYPVITVDASTEYQSIDGFGYSLTGGSAMLLAGMDDSARSTLLEELFGRDGESIGISYLRISIGASDLDPVVFSYNDLPAGQTDPDLKQFNLSRDTLYLIPILKEILKINPDISIMGSPWSAPKWMKTNNSSIGGFLKVGYYENYAQYFVKYIQAMRDQGITIDAITPQNEPQHGGNNPSMVMSAEQQGKFIRENLGPAFEEAGISTKIVLWDHNCDQPEFPISILDDEEARDYVNGSAFHLYNGSVSALSLVHNAHPDKALYFTEQWTGANGSFDGDLAWHIKNVIIGTMRNWSRVALEWNLASDPSYGPHTPGGCTECMGALTITGSSAVRNVSYYIVAHASRFVPPGSVRIESNIPGGIQNVAFMTPQGKTVMIALNESGQERFFNIYDGENWINTSIKARTVGTFVW